MSAQNSEVVTRAKSQQRRVPLLLRLSFAFSFNRSGSAGVQITRSREQILQRPAIQFRPSYTVISLPRRSDLTGLQPPSRCHCVQDCQVTWWSLSTLLLVKRTERDLSTPSIVLPESLLYWWFRMILNTHTNRHQTRDPFLLTVSLSSQATCALSTTTETLSSTPSLLAVSLVNKSVLVGCVWT